MAAWVYCFRRSIRTSHEFNPLNSIILRRSETGLRHVQSFADFHVRQRLRSSGDQHGRVKELDELSTVVMVLH